MFAYRLAAHLGVASVEEEGGLLEQISYTQLERWAEFYEIDPWGPMRTDLMLAQVCALLWNANRGKGTPGKRAKDFMPVFKTARTKPQSLEEMKAIFRQFAKVHNDALDRGK